MEDGTKRSKNSDLAQAGSIRRHIDAADTLRRACHNRLALVRADLYLLRLTGGIYLARYSTVSFGVVCCGQQGSTVDEK